MSTEMRRAVLEGIAASDEATGHERLRALELLAELDRHEVPPMPDPPPFRETDPARLAKVAELLYKAGVFESEIERRTAQRLRERFNVIAEDTESAAEPFENEEEVGGPGQHFEAVSVAESAVEDLPPWSPALAVLQRSADDGDERPTLLGRMRNRPRNH